MNNTPPAAAGRPVSEALRVFFKLPEENPRVLLPDPVTQPPVGTVDIGDEALVQQIPGAALADMGGLAELPLTEYVRVVGEYIGLLFHFRDPFKMI